jgi:hypothetical protein
MHTDKFKTLLSKHLLFFLIILFSSTLCLLSSYIFQKFGDCLKKNKKIDKQKITAVMKVEVDIITSLFEPFKH